MYDFDGSHRIDEPLKFLRCPKRYSTGKFKLLAVSQYPKCIFAKLLVASKDAV